MVIYWYRWIFFLLLLFTLSYCREVSFLSVNAYINGESTFYAKTMEIPLLENYSAKQLLGLKYGMTAFFSAAFVLLSCLGLYLSFSNRLALRLGVLIYSALFAIVLLLMLGMLFTSFENVFSSLREIAHWTHNPVIFLLLSISAFSIRLQEGKTKKES